MISPKKAILAPAKQSPLHRGLEFAHGRRQKWKNNPRGNFLFLMSLQSGLTVAFLMGGFWVLIQFVVGLCSDTPFTLKSLVLRVLDGSYRTVLELSPAGFGKLTVGFFSVVSIIYWGVSSRFNNNWLYCQNLFSTIAAMEVTDRASAERRSVVASSLCIDLVILDLWAHRAFTNGFHEILQRAITITQDELTIRAELLERFSLGDLREDEALNILEAYHLLCWQRMQKAEVTRAREKMKPGDRPSSQNSEDQSGNVSPAA